MARDVGVGVLVAVLAACAFLAGSLSGEESGLRGLAGPGEVFTSLFGNCHEAAHLHTFLNVESQFNPAQMRLFKAERAKAFPPGHWGNWSWTGVHWAQGWEDCDTSHRPDCEQQRRPGFWTNVDTGFSEGPAGKYSFDMSSLTASSSGPKAVQMVMRNLRITPAYVALPPVSESKIQYKVANPDQWHDTVPGARPWTRGLGLGPVVDLGTSRSFKLEPITLADPLSIKMTMRFKLYNDPSQPKTSVWRLLACNKNEEGMLPGFCVYVGSTGDDGHSLFLQASGGDEINPGMFDTTGTTVSNALVLVIL